LYNLEKTIGSFYLTLQLTNNLGSVMVLNFGASANFQRSQRMTIIVVVTLHSS